MTLNAQALRLLAEKGLSAADIVEVAEALEVRRDPTAAERMRRYRAKKDAGEREHVTRNVTANPPPNDIYSNPPPVPQSANADCSPLADRVVSAWNEMASAKGLSQSRKLNPKRVTALRNRAKEHGEDAVFEAIRNVGESPWHTGGNDRGWKADLGWLLTSPEHFQKLLELRPAETAKARLTPAEIAERERLRRQLDDRLGRTSDPPGTARPIGQVLPIFAAGAR